MQPVTSSRGTVRNTLLLILVLAVLWLSFSGKTDALHLGYGVLSIAIVVALTRTLVVARDETWENDYVGRINPFRVVVYVAWLVGQIIVANVQVTWMILQPKIPSDPALIVFRTGMKSSLARASLGNSITLTPGTFTLQIQGDLFLVHTIHERMATGLLNGTMQKKVAALFGETLVDDMQMTLTKDPEQVRAEVERWSS